MARTFPEAPDTTWCPTTEGHTGVVVATRQDVTTQQRFNYSPVTPCAVGRGDRLPLESGDPA